MLSFIAMGYIMNIALYILHVLVVATSTNKIDDLIYEAKTNQLKAIMSVRRPTFKLQYSLLVPFGYSYWAFSYHISYWKFKGDALDKLINYYTYN